MHISLLYKGQQAPDLLRAAYGTAKGSGRSIFKGRNKIA